LDLGTQACPFKVRFSFQKKWKSLSSEIFTMKSFCFLILVFEILVFRLAQPSLPNQGQIQFSEKWKKFEQ
jgi:hypothetical protein